MSLTGTQLTDSSRPHTDFNDVPRFWRRKNGIKLYFLLSSCLTATLALGIDGSMTNGMQVLTQWQDKFGHPTGSALGLFGAANAIGGVFPFLFLGWMGDALGRRTPTKIGSLLIIGGALIEFFATSLNMYIGGKIVLGAGSSMIQMGSPILITELSHPKERVSLTTFYNTSVVFGYVIGAWATFGCAKISNEWSWRLPTIIQVIPSVYQLILIFFCPESPRWLVAHNKREEARDILVKYHGEEDTLSPLVAFEMEEIEQALIQEKENNPTWKEFFSSRSNLRRLALCSCCAIFGQTSGNNLVSNYLTQILEDTGINSEAEITLVNGMVTLWQYFVCLSVVYLVDRFKRRTFFLVGSGGVVCVFIAWTISAQQYLENGSIAGGRMVLACIFLFQAFYTFAWTNVSVTYMLEITTYQMRAKTWAFTLLIVQVTSIFAGYINPIGLKSIGWKYYIYYCVWVAIIFVIVYFFFVETSGPTLEELTYIFEGEKAKAQIEHMKEKAEVVVEHDEVAAKV